MSNLKTKRLGVCTTIVGRHTHIGIELVRMNPLESNPIAWEQPWYIETFTYPYPRTKEPPKKERRVEGRQYFTTEKEARLRFQKECEDRRFGSRTFKQRQVLS